MNFKEKVVLISGATGGMGEEIVKLLAKEKCKFALFARRQENLKKISDELKKKNVECIFKKCDVTEIKDIKEAVELTHKTYGKIDVAILTAGILVPTPIETFDTDLIKKTMDINFMGNVYFIEHLLNVMRKQKKGMIAVTSTLPDKRGVPGWCAYGSSKAAISWLIESLRVEANQKYNVKMITIKPGSVTTPMIKNYERKGAVSAEKAAKIIIKGLEKEKKVIQFPFSQVFSIRTTDLFPTFAYDLQPVELMKGEDYPDVEEKE